MNERHDIDTRHSASSHIDLTASLIEHNPSFVGIASGDGRLLYVNPAGRALTGLDAAARVPDLFAPDDLPFFREVIQTELLRNARWNGPFRFRGASAPIAVDLTLYHLPKLPNDATAAIAIIAVEATERRRSDQRLRTLLDAGAMLTSAFDPARTFADLTELIVRTLATVCVVELFDDAVATQERSKRVASFHIDRAWRARAGQLPALATGDGSSTLVTEVDDSWIARHALSAGEAATLRAMHIRSLISVPLVAGGEIVGSLMCALGEEAVPRPGLPPAYDAEDLFFLEELGRRAGRTIETARLYERERRIAETLQAASLPTSLPSTPAYHIDAEYRPGRAEATIGGDWFDAFELVDGRVVLTVGDVLGNGLHAAVTMTKLRQAMQSAAMVRAVPNVMLDVADRTLRMHAPEGYATALAAIYDPATQTTTIASAGHPGPAIRTGDGTIREYVSSGLLLGLRDGSDDASVDIPTPPGSLLVFFTDGLTEATRDVDEGQRRLFAALAEADVIVSDRPARAIVESVLRGENAGDDIAVLTMRVH